MATFPAELGAFDHYYHTMLQGLNHLRVEPMFISAGLVDGSVAEGGAAVFLPNKMVKMPQLLAHVRSSIDLHGPSSFNKLVSTLRRISDYVKLANGLESKCAELKRQYNGDNTSTTPNSTAVSSKKEDTAGVVRLGMPYDQRPEPKKLNKFLTSYCKHWRSIGLQLGLDTAVLDVVEADHHSVSERFRVTLDKWLQLDVRATWSNLELAITNANRESLSLQPLSTIEYQGKVTEEQQSQKCDEGNDDTVESGNDASKESTAKGQSGKGVDIKPEGYPPNSRTKEGETKDDGDEDGVKSTNSVKSAKPGTAASDAGAEMTEYSKIQKKLPAYAVIINNQKFGKEGDREGADKDVNKLLQLQLGLNISFEHVLTDLTAEEIIGALKFLATRNPKDIDNEENGKGALKLLKFSEEDIKEMEDISEMRGALKAKKLRKFDNFSCLMVFLLTHGSKDDELVCLNSTTTTVEELSEIFNSENCQDLKGMPKIFFIQACRGKNQMEADHDQPNDKGDKKGDKTKSLPKEADFLFAYATPKGYLAMRDPASGSPFIQTLVNVLLNTRQHNHHLEEALLSVKHQVANQDAWYGDKKVKMMPSVVSQMRGKIEFDLTAA